MDQDSSADEAPETDLFPLTPIKGHRLLGSGPHQVPTGRHDLQTTGATARDATTVSQVRLVTSEDLHSEDQDELEDMLMEVQADEWLLLYASDGRATIDADGQQFDLRPGVLFVAADGTPTTAITHCSREFSCFAAKLNPYKLGKQLGASRAVKDRMAEVGVASHFIGLDFKGLFREMLHAAQHHDVLSKIEVQMSAMVAVSAAIRADEASSFKVPASFAQSVPDIVQEALQQLGEDLVASPTVSQVALSLNVSRGHLNKTFKQHMGISPKQYMQEMRLKRAMALLRTGEALDEVAHAIGLSTVAELRRLFKRYKDASPENYQP